MKAACSLLLSGTVCALGLNARTALVQPGPRAVREAVIAPDGRSVVYALGVADTSSRTAPVNLWRVPFSGGDPLQLTTAAAIDSHPRWTGNGERIAFLRRGLGERGSGRAFVLRASSDVADPATDESVDVASFEWSRDGRRLAYLVADADRERAAGALWIRELASGRTDRITTPQGQVRAFDWSPSGDAIAAIVGTSAAARVIVVELTGAVREIAADAAGATEIGWSSDGTLIAWLTVSRANGAVARRVLFAPATGGASRTLDGASGRPLHIAWSLGGQLSIVVEGEQERHIDVVDVHTGDRSSVMPPGIAFLTNPASWSSDGSRFAVVGSGSDHFPEVFAGARQRPMTVGRDWVGAPPPPVRRITFSNP